MRSARLSSVFFVLTAFSIVAFSPACDAPDPVQENSAAAEAFAANKAAVRGYMNRLINAHEFEAWDETFGEILVFNGHEMQKADMTRMVETFATILEGFRMEVEEQIAEGDTVVTRVTIHGTHTGDYMGLAASGKEVTFGGIALDRFADGKIVESWHQMDIWGTLLMAADD